MTAPFKNSKKAHEFIGLCLGILADNKLVKEEVEFLRDWLRRHPRVASNYPVKGLFIRLCEMLEDHFIDESEEKELFQHLYEFTGSKKKSKKVAELPSFSATIEFTEPTPQIQFEGNKFYLLGQFIIGTPDRLAEALAEKGGVLTESLDEEVDYCIVGAMAELSGDLTDDLGRQINSLKQEGMKVITEECWVDLIF